MKKKRLQPETFFNITKAFVDKNFYYMIVLEHYIVRCQAHVGIWPASGNGNVTGRSGWHYRRLGTFLSFLRLV